MAIKINLKSKAKYKSKKHSIDGIRFDSKKEAFRYVQLKMLQKAGEIKELKLQPKFLLQDSFIDHNGKKHRAIYYIADFSYIDKNGGLVVEDVKGFKTDIYRLKKKLFLYKYRDIEFKEI